MDTTTDRGAVRIILIALGIATAIVLGLIGYLTATNPTTPGAVPEQLWLIATALVSALITLATTRSKPDTAPQVFDQTLDELRPGAMGAGQLNPPHGTPPPPAGENPGKATRSW